MRRVSSAIGTLRDSAATAPLLGGAAVAVGAITILNRLGGNYYAAIFALALSFAFVTLGMAVQIGYANQVVLSQSVFMGIGAYGTAVLNTKYGWSIGLGIAAVVAVSAVVAALVGRLLVRVEGFALALVTLFFAVVAVNIVVFSDFLGGFNGLAGVTPIIPADSTNQAAYWSGVVAAVLLGLCVAVCARIVRSGVGLELAVLGADEGMAQSLGVRTRRRKVELFVLGSVLAALGGAVFAGTQSYISVGSFDQSAELTLLIMLFLGGRRSIAGALLGTVGIELLSGASNFIATHLLIIEGVLFTLILLAAPDGATALVHHSVQAMARRRRRTPARAVSDDPTAVGPAPIVEGAADSGGPPPAIRSAAIPRRNSSREGWDLRCAGLTRRFGGLTAVDDVTVRFGGGGVHAVVGPNGAGKSTLFALLAGGLRADGGRVFFGERDVSALNSTDRAALGLTRTFQSVRLVDRLSALDNVAVAALPSHRTWLTHGLFSSDVPTARGLARDALEAFGVGDLAEARPGELTLEGLRMVELARATVASPTVLLLDEPASGLSEEQRDRLGSTLTALGEQMTVVLVEHDLQLVASVASEVFALIDGRIAYHGEPAGFTQDPVVRARLLGLIDQVNEPLVAVAKERPYVKRARTSQDERMSESAEKR